VAWREDLNERGQKQKVPYSPSHQGKKAKSNDRSTWASRSVADQSFRRLKVLPGHMGGVGIELGTIDGEPDLMIGGIDLDSCLNADGGLEPWAAEVVARFKSYTEISPSGSGAKVFFAYRVEDATGIREAMRVAGATGQFCRMAWSAGPHHEIGLDLAGRYYTVTDRHLIGTPRNLSRVSLSEFIWLIEVAGPAFKAATTVENASAPNRDESGSGYGYRFLLEQALEDRDCTDVAALAALARDNGPAGEWSRRTTARELRRAWANAHAAAERERPVDPESAFDEEGPDSDPAGARKPEAAPVDPVTSRLNARHAVVAVRGRTLITTERADGSVDFGTVTDLHTIKTIACRQ
jgi:putative DNA primase/helicase